MNEPDNENGAQGDFRLRPSQRVAIRTARPVICGREMSVSFLWEEVDIVTEGGNYGWSVREGAHHYKPGWQMVH